MTRKPKAAAGDGLPLGDDTPASQAEPTSQEIEAAAAEEAEQAPPNPLLEKIVSNPLIVIQEPETFPELLKVMRAELDALHADPATPKGRQALVSMAYKVTRTKTAIAASVTDATREWREQIEALNSKRREVIPQLEALAEEIRRPVDEWEAEEKRRKEIVDTELNLLDDAIRITITDTVARLEEKLTTLRAKTFDEAVFKNQLPLAESKRKRAIEGIEGALPGLRQAEAERLELAELRRQNDERKAKEAAEAEAKAKAERDAKAAEERRVAEEKRQAAETARVKAAEEAAAAKAKADAETAAAAEQARKDADAKRLIEEANKRAQEAEEKRIREQLAAEQREKDRVAEEARKQREADVLADKERRNEERRQANRAHQGRVMKAAKEGIIKVLVKAYADAGEENAKALAEGCAVFIVKALVEQLVEQGKNPDAEPLIPHVSIKF